MSRPLPAEKEARRQAAEVGRILRPEGRKPVLPGLTADSPAADYLRFALLNHPQVAAAYYDWRATFEAIAPTRALPDPKFTFEADITDTIMTFMPGLMFDFMLPGKRAAMGREATAGSAIAYREFVSSALRTATEVRKAWVELAYINEARGLHVGAATAVEEAIEVANADYATGQGMASFEAQMRLRNAAAAHHTHHASLDDRLVAARARFKASLGLGSVDADPPWPQTALTVTPLAPPDELWRRVQAANPDLGRMRAMVEMAVAGVAVARQTGVPDFAPGAMVDLKADPLMIRPTATITLPVWRKKIAATVAAAQTRREAAVARLSAEEVNLAAEFAQMLFMVRESDRMIAYIDDTALPNLERNLATVAAGYQSGMTGAAMIPETRRMILEMRIERMDALRERELVVPDLLLITADPVLGGNVLPQTDGAAAAGP